MVPFPGDAYMLTLAKAIYTVSYLEWTILGDLDRLPEEPEALTVANLSRKTTGQVLGAVKEAAKTAEEGSPEGQWLQAAAEAIHAVLDERNAVIHAHPATIENEQMLYRWATENSKHQHQALPITQSYLEKLMEKAHHHLNILSKLRLPAN